MGPMPQFLGCELAITTILRPQSRSEGRRFSVAYDLLVAEEILIAINGTVVYCLGLVKHRLTVAI